MSIGKVLVYGGRGALGAACVSHFKANNWWVGSIDLVANEQADVSVVVPRDGSWVEQENEVLTKVNDVLQDEKVDAIICVAGGWAGGNALKDLAKSADLMWKQSVWTSSISATIAARYLKNGGVLTLTGAKPALQGTPGMIGYGMAKAAVHQLTKSLAGKDSGLPNNSVVVAILPITLDTPMNRKWMPDADTTTWTPLTFIAEENELYLTKYAFGLRFKQDFFNRTFGKWIKGEDRPKSGSLLQLVTTDSETKLIPHE